MSMENRILTELPRRNNKIDYRSMVGMEIDAIFRNNRYKIKILELFKDKKGVKRFRTVCNDNMTDVQCGQFISASLKGVVGYKNPSKNKFEYSEEHSCWFGWTQKGEKFAFDGDEETVNFIKKHTWRYDGDKISCGFIRRSLKQIVLKLENTRLRTISNISNELNLMNKNLDCRRINLKINNNEPRKRGSIKTGDYEYKMELSEDKTFYKVYDKNGEVFLIDNDERSLKIIKTMRAVVRKTNNKKYVHCGEKGLHRILFGITDAKYSTWFIDHINGDGTDNRFFNLVITDHYGNMCNKKGKGYRKLENGKFGVTYMVDLKFIDIHRNGRKYKVFETEQEAIDEVNRRRNFILENRLSFKTKEELDKYLENQKQ